MNSNRNAKGGPAHHAGAARPDGAPRRARPSPGCAGACPGRPARLGSSARAAPELAAEQAYVDTRTTCLDRMRATVGRTQEAMATEWAALEMEAWAKRRAHTFEDAERGLCFGRLTSTERRGPLYVGRRWVTTTSRSRSSSTGRRRRRGRSIPRRRRIRRGHAAAPLPREGAEAPRHLRRVARRQRRSRARRSPTSSSRSSTAAATRGCATSSRRSSPTSTA